MPRHFARRLAVLRKPSRRSRGPRHRRMLDDIIRDDSARPPHPIPATQDRLLAAKGRDRQLAVRLIQPVLAVAHLQEDLPETRRTRRTRSCPNKRTSPLLDLNETDAAHHASVSSIDANLRPLCSNHGCPWIQKVAQKTTCVLGPIANPDLAGPSLVCGGSLHIAEATENVVVGYRHCTEWMVHASKIGPDENPQPDATHQSRHAIFEVAPRRSRPQHDAVTRVCCRYEQVCKNRASSIRRRYAPVCL